MTADIDTLEEQLARIAWCESHGLGKEAMNADPVVCICPCHLFPPRRKPCALCWLWHEAQR